MDRLFVIEKALSLLVGFYENAMDGSGRIYRSSTGLNAEAMKGPEGDLGPSG